MSLILEALKKLDREKSSRRSGTVNIAADILKPDLSRPGRRISLYLAAVSLTAVVTVVITYGVISKSSPPPPLNLPMPSQQTPSVPPSRVPVQESGKESGGLSTKIQPSVEVKKPVEVKKRVEMKKPLEIKKPVEMKKPVEVKVPKEVRKPAEVIIPAESEPASENKSTGVPSEEKKPSSDVVSEKPVVAPKNLGKPAEQTPLVSSTTPSSLKISAIVWYEEPSKRFAMINGVIVTEGSIIEGVKVVEIMPTSVRLSHNDQPFEISISK
jgi:hypothetical protein